MLKDVLNIVNGIATELEKIGHWDLSKKAHGAMDKIKELIRESTHCCIEAMDDIDEEIKKELENDSRK